MAQVIIGGTTYEVGELNFVSLDRAWPHIEMAMATADPMIGASAAFGVIAAGIMEEDYFKPETFGIEVDKLDEFRDRDNQIHELVVKFLKRKTKASELGGVREALESIIEEGGLKKDEATGELEPSEEAANLSTVTSTPSSPNSSQPELKGVVGTE